MDEALQNTLRSGKTSIVEILVDTDKTAVSTKKVE